MAKNKIVLPRTYKNDKSGRYPQHVGKPKISYSQHTSWIEESYRPEYILQYFSKIDVGSNIFAEYGGETGEYIENYAKGVKNNPIMLNKESIDVLQGIHYPEKSEYEEEIVVDCGHYVIQGFIDRTEYISDKEVGILDFKTGNIDKKVEFYSSEDYGQTTLYSYQKTQEGFKIGYSKVLLLGRKGNGREGHPLRLSGDSVYIDTPYSEERAQKVLKKIDNSVNEIAEAYKTYKKFF